jgi:hypothetical protein
MALMTGVWSKMKIQWSGGTPDSHLELSGSPKGGSVQFLHKTPDGIVVVLGTTSFREEFKFRIASADSASSDEIASWSLHAPGSLICYSRLSGEMRVSVDCLGCFPIFFKILSTNRIWLSDQITELATADESIDPVGITEYLRFGYSIGDRTLFPNVHRIRPGEIAVFSLDGSMPRLRDNSTLWALPAPFEDGVTVDSFCERIVSAVSLDRPGILMMSGGWDSRLLLAAAMAADLPKRPTLYFHGDTSSREASIVGELQAAVGLEARMVEIRPDMFTPARLATNFDHYESLSFPHWHSVRVQPEAAKSVIMAGIFGEVIGGHYGPPMLASGVSKVVQSLRWILFRRFPDLGREGVPQFAQARKLLKQDAYPHPWYMRREAWNDEYQDIHVLIEADIEKELSRFSKRGITEAHTLLEAFLSENRASQYIAAQLHSAAQSGGFSAPFAHRPVIEMASAIPFGAKAFNSFTQMAIRKLCPALLAFPTAATLCNASRPIYLLEATRALRKATGMVPRKRPSRTSATRLSWVNFSEVASSGVLEQVASSLFHPMWDKPAMLSRIRTCPASEAHPVTDMLLKIKTLDMAVCGGEQDIRAPQKIVTEIA